MEGEQRSAASTEALRRFSAAFPSQTVDTWSGASPFELDFQRIATDRFAISRLRCTGIMRSFGPLPEAVAVGRRTSGAVRIQREGLAVDTSRPYLRPIASTEFELRDGAVMLVALQPVAVAEYLERAGERGVSGRGTGTAPQLAAWGLVMDHAATYLDRPEALTPQAEVELHDLLCWSLLHAFDDPWAETRRAGAHSKALRRALQHMDEHADEAVTMPEVAEAARVSVRGLGLLFRRELDTTPLHWLRDLRLDRARFDLLGGRGTVAEIAAGHGIPHAGRFAAQYRARFDESPAATLRGTAARSDGRGGPVAEDAPPE